MVTQAVTTVATEEAAKIIEGVIWIDPERVSGAPCFINTRVPIQNLFDYLEGGEPLEEFLEGSRLSPASKRSRFWSLLEPASSILSSMVKILLDHNLDWRLSRCLPSHEVKSTIQQKCGAFRNGRLLDETEKE